MLRFLLIFSLLVSLLVTGCDSEPEALPIIRLGHAPHDHHAALYVVAQLPEYFRQQGGLYLEEITFKQRYRLIEQGREIAEINVQPGVGGGQLIRKLHEKQLDVALGAVPAMLKQIDAGSDLKMVAPLMSEGAALVMGKDSSVTDWPSFVEMAKRAEKPLRIGYKIETSVQNLIFEQALRAEKIPFSREEVIGGAKIVVLNLHGSKNLIPALKNGLIDGFVIMQPFAALAEYQQVGKTVAKLCDLPPEQQWAGHPCCAIAANGALLERERDLLSKLVALLLRGNRYLQQHPEESAELVARWLEKPVEVERLSLPTIKYLVDFPGTWHRGVDSWVLTMSKQGRLQGGLRAAVQDGSAKKLLYEMEIYDRARELVK